MSFQAFEQAISSPALKHVACHWNEVRGPNKMPPWKSINPRTISAQLPLIWSFKYNRATNTFIGRLSGDQIDRIYARNIKGVPMSELPPAADYARLFERTKRVVCEPAFFKGDGMVFSHLDRYGQGERIMLPIGADGLTGDGVLGATIYQTMLGRSKGHHSEDESWFSL